MDSTYPLTLSCLHNPVQGAWPARWKDPLFQLEEREQHRLDNSFIPTYADPMHIETPGGARFFVLFTDDFSGYRTVFFLKQKSDVSDCFKEFVNILYTETGQLVYTLRADNGGEFTGQTIRL